MRDDLAQDIPDAVHINIGYQTQNYFFKGNISRWCWTPPAYCLFSCSLYCTFFHTYCLFTFYLISFTLISLSCLLHSPNSLFGWPLPFWHMIAEWHATVTPEWCTGSVRDSNHQFSDYEINTLISTPSCFPFKPKTTLWKTANILINEKEKAYVDKTLLTHVQTYISDTNRFAGNWYAN